MEAKVAAGAVGIIKKGFAEEAVTSAESEKTEEQMRGTGGRETLRGKEYVAGVVGNGEDEKEGKRGNKGKGGTGTNSFISGAEEEEALKVLKPSNEERPEGETDA